MTELVFKTNKQDLRPDEIKKLPKVYFSCHPDDLKDTFDTVCNDIFRTHECVVFYKKDMADELPEDTRDVDLSRMNLFVFPVTFNLLDSENLSVKRDIEFANRRKKPVLPIVYERFDRFDPKAAEKEKLFNELYGRPDFFRARQYLSKYSTDATAIGFEEKLKKYLDVTLLDARTVEKIKQAFDAYIFLSYRKKDRKYANELMHIIHKDPLFWDIAIWFDEFLTPGESFEESIKKALRDSKFISLLVTSSLLENDVYGNPNYVQRVEYPLAKSSGKAVLPARSSKSGEIDEEKLYKCYEGLSKVISFEDEEIFRKAFRDALGDAVCRENDDDPEHNYLIALAYLDGIDVERNEEFGLELLTKAGEGELPEAMNKLYWIYKTGMTGEIDDQKALYWIKKLYSYDLKNYGEENSRSINDLHLLADAYFQANDMKNSLEAYEKCYRIRCRVLGENAKDTVGTLYDMAEKYGERGNKLKQLELLEKCYDSRSKSQDSIDPEFIKLIGSLADIYHYFEKKDKELEMLQKSYEMRCELYGEEHEKSLEKLLSLSSFYRTAGDDKKSLELVEKCYNTVSVYYSEDDPRTLRLLSDIADYYGNKHKRSEIKKKCYEMSCKINGCEHKETLGYLSSLAFYFGRLGEYDKEIELLEKIYETSLREYGEGDKYTLSSLESVANSFSYREDKEKQISILKKCYETSCRFYGEQDRKSLDLLRQIAELYRKLGFPEKRTELLKKNFEICLEKYGEEDNNTINSLYALSDAYHAQKRYKDEFDLLEKLSEAGKRKMENGSVDLYKNLALLYCKLGCYTKGTEMLESLYRFCLNEYGEGYDSTLFVLESLAGMYKAFYPRNRAYKLLAKIYDVKHRMLGADKDEVHLAMNELKNAVNAYRCANDKIKNDDEVLEYVAGLDDDCDIEDQPPYIGLIVPDPEEAEMEFADDEDEDEDDDDEDLDGLFI